MVEGPNGPMYTRSGTFQPNRLGQVVTPEGFALLDAQGRQITLPPDAVDVSVLDDGSVDRKSTRLNSSHIPLSRMPSSA